MVKITQHSTGKFVTTIQVDGVRKYLYGKTEYEVSIAGR